MKFSVLWAVGGLMLGGIIHIASVLWVPATATNDSWTQITGLGPVNTLHLITPTQDGHTPLPDLDPSLRYAVCRYDLTDGPLLITSQVPLVYWSVALYDRRGLNYYALNDRLVAGRSIRLWVATKQQLLAIEPQTSDTVGDDQRLLIGAPGVLGFAVFRALVPGPSFAASVDSAFEETSCSTYDPRAARDLLSEFGGTTQTR
jgi:uncharacterized membrane protein